MRPIECKWKLPGEDSYHLLTGQAEHTMVDSINLNQSGFLLAPFDLNNGVYVLRGEPIVRTMPNVEFDSNKNQRELKLIENKESYLKKGELLRTTFDSGQLQKVVLSRTLDLQVQIDSNDLFEALSHSYPNAFVYHVNLGDQSWIGASPEILLQKRNNRVLTYSLAGTKPVGSGSDWTNKELEEQNLVTDYILECFKNAGVNDIVVGKLTTRLAGNVQHLLTELSATLKSSEVLPQLLKNLHPTPAVAGLPLTSALEWISHNEGYDREFYAGFVGPIGLDMDLFVNLRCLKQSDKGIRLYVGGGYTAQSDPLSEWNETVEKSKTLLSVISQIK